MKHLTLFLTAICTVALICSCNKDACKDVTCQNGGACTDGKCSCPAGYIGDLCETKDLCYGITCQNGGTCSNGICNCPTGYSGTNCQTVANAKFVGTWSVYGGSCGLVYNPASTANSNAMKFNLNDLNGTSTNGVVADILSNLTDFTIPEQLNAIGTVKISGNGSINSAGTQMTVTYYLKSPSSGTTIGSCVNATFDKQ